MTREAPQDHLFQFWVNIQIYGEMRETDLSRFNKRFESIMREGLEDINASLPGRFYEWNVKGRSWIIRSPKSIKNTVPPIPAFPPALDWLP